MIHLQRHAKNFQKNWLQSVYGFKTSWLKDNATFHDGFETLSFFVRFLPMCFKDNEGSCMLPSRLKLLGSVLNDDLVGQVDGSIKKYGGRAPFSDMSSSTNMEARSKRCHEAYRTKKGQVCNDENLNPGQQSHADDNMPPLNTRHGVRGT